jgi:hypothetical protein
MRETVSRGEMEMLLVAAGARWGRRNRRSVRRKEDFRFRGNDGAEKGMGGVSHGWRGSGTGLAYD